jgi:hypothetical protein
MMTSSPKATKTRTTRAGARRARPGAGVKKGKAAWSKLEDVLAERRLKKELTDFDEE